MKEAEQIKQHAEQKINPATLALVAAATRLNQAARQRHALSEVDLLPPLLLLSDDVRLPDPRAALEHLPVGSGFIFRHYDDPYREKTGLALRALARQRDIVFLVAEDIDLALRLKADGCHMPEHALARLQECHSIPGLRFNTGAAHSVQALESAAKLGANAALISPVFSTRSHPGAPPLGLKAAVHMAQAASLPTYALGGINAETAPALAQSAFAGLAAIEGLAAVEDLAP